MIKSPITLCLYSSSKGHFGRRDVYQSTVNGLLAQVPASAWGGLLAHVKYGTAEPGAVSDDLNQASSMDAWLKSQGFKVTATHGIWSHFADSHQLGYIADVRRLLDQVTTPYVLSHEDDWHLAPYQHDLEYWLHEGVRALEADPTLVQVRFARFTDEPQRILNLMARHRIDGKSQVPSATDKLFRHNDFSMNPSLFRTRDLRAALAFLAACPSLPQHIEHGTSITLKVISGAELPFACFNPLMVRAGHLGTRTVEEQDDLSKPLLFFPPVTT